MEFIGVVKLVFYLQQSWRGEEEGTTSSNSIYFKLRFQFESTLGLRCFFIGTTFYDIRLRHLNALIKPFMVK